MLGKLLIIVPIILFFILLFAFNYFGILKSLNSKFNNFPIIFISFLVTIFFILSLFLFAIFDGYSIKSKYTPPYIKDGKLMQGKFEE
tara:strand:+ start:2990 stop:3250 length:261 start_codon:yes stop_codon:yes gene_type:complete